MAQFQVRAIGEDVVRDALARHAAGDPHVEEQLIETPTGHPCRITLAEIPAGERALLFRHSPFDAPSPYAEAGPIFARIARPPARLGANEVPAFVAERPLVVVRAYDNVNAIASGEVVAGEACAAAIARALDDDATAYVHVRSAAYGCFLFRADRG
ncbi:MAG: DUF1203 domain-containing protein [Alphaproteobacteria bacterium]